MHNDMHIIDRFVELSVNASKQRKCLGILAIALTVCAVVTHSKIEEHNKKIDILEREVKELRETKGE